MSRKFLVPIVLPADPAAAMEAATKQYVDSKAGGSSVDEVWIGSAPSDPNIELWVDSSATNLTDPNVARWNSAWGAVGSSKSTLLQNIPSNGATFTTLNNIAVTFTAVAGRKYAISAVFDFRQRTNTGSVYMKIFDAVDGDLQLGLSWASLADGYCVVPLMLANWTPSAGSHTVRLAGTTNGTSVDFNSYGGTNLLVEDVGPVSMSSPPPVGAAVGAWTTMPFNTNWGAMWPCSYRKVGDIVYLRGLAATTATAGTTIATLPVGFRPALTCMCAVMQASLGRPGRLDVNADGTMVVQETVNTGAGQWVQLDGIQFSVTL